MKATQRLHEVHLMIAEPDRFLDAFSRAGALADAGMTIAVAGTSVFDPRAPVAANVRVLRAACGVRATA